MLTGICPFGPTFPSGYNFVQGGGTCNPYFGGFGHVNLPQAGAGYAWPAYTWPFNFQSPVFFAVKAGFVA
jgi:hypothetical protein